MVATPNIGHFLLWAAVALGMVGALPVQDSTSMVSAESSISSPIPPSETNDDVAALCTDGVSATKQNSAGGYPINNYTVVTPGMNWTSYTVDGDWYHKHYVSGPHYMTFTHASDPFGAFKCQFTCNADSKCASFFVWYEDIGTEDEHLNCVLFDAIIPASAFVKTEGIISTGAYDRLCDSHSV